MREREGGRCCPWKRLPDIRTNSTAKEKKLNHNHNYLKRLKCQRSHVYSESQASPHMFQHIAQSCPIRVGLRGSREQRPVFNKMTLIPLACGSACSVSGGILLPSLGAAGYKNLQVPVGLRGRMSLLRSKHNRKKLKD